MYIPVCVLTAALLAIFFTMDLSGQKKKNFVGYETCIPCHGQETLGNQIGVWRSSPHARAYRILSTSEALIIADKAGVGKPQEDAACLSCHNTAAGKYDSVKGEGVGCEACHGPAGNWYEYENHVSLTNRSAGYRKAVSLGMYPIIGIDSIKFREKMCRRCHTAERPCVPEEVTDRKQLKMPLEFISDFIFKHPVRR